MLRDGNPYPLFLLTRRKSLEYLERSPGFIYEIAGVIASLRLVAHPIQCTFSMQNVFNVM